MASGEHQPHCGFDLARAVGLGELIAEARGHSYPSQNNVTRPSGGRREPAAGKWPLPEPVARVFLHVVWRFANWYSRAFRKGG